MRKVLMAVWMIVLAAAGATLLPPAALANDRDDQALLREFAAADYRDLDRLRAMLSRFEAHIHDHKGDVSGDVLVYAASMASCLWNVTASAEEQKRISELGYQWAKLLYAREPQRIDAGYFMALNLFMYASSRGILDTLFALRDVRKYADETYAKDKAYFHHSAGILLGALYHDAPGFPIAFGDAAKGITYLEEAIRTEPKQTTAIMLYAGILAEKGDRQGTEAALRKILAIPGWKNPRTMIEKDMDFWWHVDRIRAARGLQALQEGTALGDLRPLLEAAPRRIKGASLVAALQEAGGR